MVFVILANREDTPEFWEVQAQNDVMAITMLAQSVPGIHIVRVMGGYSEEQVERGNKHTH